MWREACVGGDGTVGDNAKEEGTVLYTWLHPLSEISKGKARDNFNGSQYGNHFSEARRTLHLQRTRALNKEM